jgi:hypothetical protein
MKLDCAHIKKIVFSLILLFCIQGIEAERYKVELKLRFISNDKHMECDTPADVIITYDNGTTEKRHYSVPGEKDRNQEYIKNDVFYTDKIIRSIKCNGIHKDNPTGPRTCYEHCTGSTGGTIYDYDYPCVKKRYNKFFGSDDGGTYIEITVTPVPPVITYSTNGLTGLNNTGEESLPDTKKIKITAAGGYHSSVYQWKYAFDGGPSGNIPESCISPNQEEIEICGFDLTPDFQNYLYKSVRIYIDYGCGASNSRTLTAKPCAPEIVSARGIDVTCENGVKSGRFEVELSRTPYPGESLEFLVMYSNSQDNFGTNYGSKYIKINQDNPQKLSFPYFDQPGADPAFARFQGTYNIKISSLFSNGGTAFVDASGSFIYNNLVINEPEPLDFNGSIVTTNINCRGNRDGTITVKAKGGSGQYVVRLRGNNDFTHTTETFQGAVVITELSPGDYDVYLSDAGGCDEVSKLVTIEASQDVFGLTTVNTEQASLNEYLQEENNGRIDIGINCIPDYAPYQYVWTDASGNVLLGEQTNNTGSSLKDINSGTYSVTVTNKKGCSFTESVVLPKAPEIIISITQTGRIMCSGDNTGQLTASVDGGTAPYTYTWYKIDEYSGNEGQVGSGSPVLSGITAGTYRLVVFDSQGYRIRSREFYHTEENPIIASFDTEKLDCHYSSDGFLKVNVSGGTPPYTYLWDNGNTGTRIGNLPSGNYGITVTDNAGCHRRFVGTVHAPEPLSVDATTVHPLCYGESSGYVTLHISGGTTPYNISWSNGGNQTTNRDLRAGTYRVTVSDANNCQEITKTYILRNPAPIEIRPGDYRPVTKAGDSDGMFSIYITGGNPPYSITCLRDGRRWYTPKSVLEQADGSYLAVFDRMPEGNYEVTVNNNGNQSSAGCSATYTITVSEPPPIWVTINETHPITCAGGDDGELTATGEGGEQDSPIPYLYEWFKVEGYNKTLLQTGNTVLSGLSAGTYSVKITDKNGISASAEYRLIAPAVLSLTFDVTDVSCPGGDDGSVIARVKGGGGQYTYLWSTGETDADISGKVAGGYSVTVTDSRGCQISGSDTIKNPEEMSISSEVYPVTCYGSKDGSIYLKIEGGTFPYDFLWSTGETDPFIENKLQGSYSVTITDSKACSKDTTFFISEPDSISVKLLELRQPIGFGYKDGLISVEISGGNMPPYTVVWRDSTGNEIPGDTLVYSEDKAVSTLENIGEGFYYLDIKDAKYNMAIELEVDSCGCRDSLSFYMPQPPKLIVNIEKQHDVLCYGSNEGIISSTAEGGVPFEEGLPYIYKWERNGVSYVDSIIDLQGIPIGVYRLTIIDKNGITATSETVVITQPDSLALQFSASEIQCWRDSTGWAEVAVTGGVVPYTYEWSNGATTPKIENTGRGKHMVWVRDANGCEVTGMAEIIQSNGIQVKAEVIRPVCRGGSDGQISITLSKGEPPYSYQWEDGSKSLVRTGLKQGSYTFTVSDQYGCGYEEVTFELKDPDEIIVDLGEDRELCAGQSLKVQAKVSEPVSSVTWFDPDGKQFHTGDTCTVSDAGTYTVHVITEKACNAYGHVTITRDDRIIVADFVVASQVPVRDEVYMVNISNPEPDRIEWILPEEKTDNYEVFMENGQMLGIIFREYGYYTVGMRSYSGDCMETVYKTIRVMDKIDIDNYDDADEPWLKTFSATPNPARDRFTVTVELKAPAPVDLYLVDSGTGIIVERKRLSGEKDYRTVFETPGIRKGVFVLGLSSPKAKAVTKVILY